MVTGERIIAEGWTKYALPWSLAQIPTRVASSEWLVANDVSGGVNKQELPGIVLIRPGQLLMSVMQKTAYIKTNALTTFLIVSLVDL